MVPTDGDVGEVILFADPLAVADLGKLRVCDVTEGEGALASLVLFHDLEAGVDHEIGRGPLAGNPVKRAVDWLGLKRLVVGVNPVDGRIRRHRERPQPEEAVGVPGEFGFVVGERRASGVEQLHRPPMDQINRGLQLEQPRLDPFFLVEKPVHPGGQGVGLDVKPGVVAVLRDAQVFAEQGGHVYVAEEHRAVHRRLPGLVARVDVRAVNEQQPGHLHEAADRREVERRRLVVVPAVDGRAVGEQQLGDFNVAVLGGVMQRGLAGPVVHRVDVRAGVDVGANGGDVVAPTGRRPDRQLWRGARGNNPPQRKTKD